MSKELPTRREVASSVFDVFTQCPAAMRTTSNWADMVADALIRAGWLEVAPGPTPEPDDPENWVVVDGEGFFYTWNADVSEWQTDGGEAIQWHKMPSPVRLARFIDAHERPNTDVEEVLGDLQRMIDLAASATAQDADTEAQRAQIALGAALLSTLRHRKVGE